jgi:hypothetical protein
MPAGCTTLHGIVDAARDDRLYDALHAEPKDSQVACLYDGAPAIRYGRYAPHLMMIHKDSPLFDRWMDTGWDAHWGIFLAGNATTEKLKRHLKRFLTGTGAAGQKIWLRFYDPQVLPGMLEGLDPGNLNDWFGSGLIQACLAPCPQGIWRGTPQRSLLDRMSTSARLQSQVFKV